MLFTGTRAAAAMGAEAEAETVEIGCCGEERGGFGRAPDEKTAQFWDL